MTHANEKDIIYLNLCVFILFRCLMELICCCVLLDYRVAGRVLQADSGYH